MISDNAIYGVVPLDLEIAWHDFGSYHLRPLSSYTAEMGQSEIKVNHMEHTHVVTV